MNSKIKVSVLGGTGMVGQIYISLLSKHPWFQIVDIAASERSSGKTFKEVLKDRWKLKKNFPNQINNILIRNIFDFNSIPKDVELIFSAAELENKLKTQKLEFEYAKNGFSVVSNTSANRWTDDVPMIIPEINSDHLDILKIQQSKRSFPKNGFVVSKSNCSIQSFLVAIDALNKAGHNVKKINVTTMQALSGGGIKIINDKNFQNNVVPYINGEEEKTENEPLKIFGKIKNNKIEKSQNLFINAFCSRIPIIDGHSAVVQLKFEKKPPEINEILNIWESYKSLPQLLKLPTAPYSPIKYFEEDNRPQPALDVFNDKGMTVSIGRLKKDKIFDVKFFAMSHNTIRGAAGGAILAAELLFKQNFLKTHEKQN